MQIKHIYVHKYKYVHYKCVHFSAEGVKIVTRVHSPQLWYLTWLPGILLYGFRQMSTPQDAKGTGVPPISAISRQ